jgi:hypothetical protein
LHNQITFQTIAHLFKTLSRLIVQDPLPTLSLMAPLLASKTSHIRSFAAEAFGFLLRRIPGETLERVLAELFLFLRSEKGSTKVADDTEEILLPLNKGPLVAGASALILESVTHVRGLLHSRATGLLGSVLDLVLSETTEGLQGMISDPSSKSLGSLIQNPLS